MKRLGSPSRNDTVPGGGRFVFFAARRVGNQRPAATVLGMVTNNVAVHSGQIDQELFDTPLTVTQLCLLPYNKSLNPAGKLALLCEPELQRHLDGFYDYMLEPEVAERVVAHYGIAELERNRGPHAKPVVANVGPAAARQIATGVKNVELLVTVLRRVADAGHPHALTPKEAERALRRTKFSAGAARMLALKGYRFPIGELPKYVSNTKRLEGGVWLAAIEEDVDQAVRFLRGAYADEPGRSFAVTRPHLMDAYLNGAEFSGMMRGLSSMVIEDRDLWQQVARLELAKGQTITSTTYDQFRTHPYATDDIVDAATQAVTAWVVDGRKAVPSGLADYVLGRKPTVPLDMVGPARKFLNSRHYPWQYGKLLELTWPEGTYPTDKRPRTTCPVGPQKTLTPIVAYLNETFGRDPDAWGKFAALAAQIGSQVSIRDLVALVVE